MEKLADKQVCLELRKSFSNTVITLKQCNNELIKKRNNNKKWEQEI